MLAEFEGKPGVRALEIGCFEGRATRWLLENILTNRSSRITVVDTFKGDEQLWRDAAKVAGKEATELLRRELEERFRHNIRGFSRQVIIEKGDSKQVLRGYNPNLSSRSFDFSYIDGSHKAPDVIEDAVLVWPLLKEGGILIFDDYGWKLRAHDSRKPKLGIDAFLSAYAGEFELVSSGYQMVVRKEKCALAPPA